MMKQQLKVHNIKCGGCANSIKSQLEKIQGISNVLVDEQNGHVDFSSSNLESIDIVKQTLAQMGYPEDDPSMVQTAKSYVSCLIGRMK